MKYLTKFADKITALEFTTGGGILMAPQVSKVGNDAIFSESIKRGKSCIFVEENDGRLKLVEPPEAFITFTSEEDNSSIGLNKLSTNQILEYSTDTTTWNTFDTTTNIPLNNGDKVYVRGVLSGNNTTSNYTRFKMTGKIAASGNCNTLWNYNDLDAPLKEYCGYYMFQNCTSLTTAPELPAIELASGCYKSMFDRCTSLVQAPELPATTLDNDCYNGMFIRCTSLVQAPELPATELADSCYYYMFYGCTSLVQAPELPAIIVANNCYGSMFSNCTSLTTAPSILPATTLASECYRAMFSQCTSLVKAPELPAMTLIEKCYHYMFNGCNSLKYIKCLATDISASSCTYEWTYGVYSTTDGTFVKHQDMTGWTAGVNGIPEGWTVIDAEL